MSEALKFQLGAVVQIWAVDSKGNLQTHLGIKDRAKRRIREEKYDIFIFRGVQSFEKELLVN